MKGSALIEISDVSADHEPNLATCVGLTYVLRNAYTLACAIFACCVFILVELDHACGTRWSDPKRRRPRRFGADRCSQLSAWHHHAN